MGSLYKYLPSQHLDKFLGGAVLFRSLSYFRAFEDLQIRGDRHEGARLYAPSTGLSLQVNGAAQPVVVPMAFEAQAKDREILVFCLSSLLSSELAMEFEADVCVELTEPEQFLRRIQRALASRPSLKYSSLVHDFVTYYDPEISPLAAWALPDRIALSKVVRYKRQAEYRLAFGRRKAFTVNNVQTRLTSTSGQLAPNLQNHPQAVLQVGDLARICKIHRF